MCSWSGVLLLTLVSGCALGQVEASDNPVCIKASAFRVPPRDQPSPAEQARLKGCSALDLFYGVGQPPDFRKARACAYAVRGAEPEKNEQSGPDGIEAPAVLAMIYAGGNGVAPNLQLAEKFACEVRAGWDDGTGTAVRLNELRAQGNRSAALDFCKDVSGRWMNYYCITRDQAWVDAALKREERLARSSGQPGARAAFVRLAAARRAYLDAHIAEQPSGTTGSAQMVLRDDVDEAQHWLAMLREVRSGTPPSLDESAFHKADRALNAAYRQSISLSHWSSGQYGDATEEQLRIAERAWMRFREAWVGYARLRLPKVPADRWRAELTLQRIGMLGGA